MRSAGELAGEPRQANRATRRGRRGALLLLAVLCLPLLAACGGDDERSQAIAWREDPTPTVAATPVATNPPGMGGATAFTPVTLSAAEINHYQPNELGLIPILMYHAFSTDPSKLDEWTRTPDSLREDLAWLYAHNFHIVSIADLINNEILVPPGKHPVALTFDDSSSGQFRLLRDEQGEFYPDPDTAVGVMEAFFARHPDFGRGAFFAVLPYKCFSYDEEEATCEERLTWLDEHGYEIGNHTWGHQNLANVSEETLISQVARTKIWIDERVTGDGNLGNVLVLPFGNMPEADWQVQLLHEGFVYEGQRIYLAGIVMAWGGLSASPSSGEWTRWRIGRFNTDPETWEYWKGLIEDGAVTLYTSDGNPETVTLPIPLPEDVAPAYDAEWASSYGMEVIRYDVPDPTPMREASPLPEGSPAMPDADGMPDPD